MKHTHTHWLRPTLLTVFLVGLVFVMSGNPSGTIQAQAGGTLGYGSKVYGTIAAGVPPVAYSFSGTAGDLVTITADKWTGSLDVQLDLVAPNGLVLASSTQNMPAGDPSGAYLSVLLQQTGAYLIRISGAN